MLIVLGGLPGTGKTTIARELVARLPAAYLRIDTIEHALRKAGELHEVGPLGYLVAYELAKSNLALGNTVVADCVNPMAVTREAWRDVASSASKELLEVEVVCTDTTEHRRRVESRTADISGGRLPDWGEVLRREYEVWTSQRLIIDSAVISANEAASLIFQSSRGRTLAT